MNFYKVDRVSILYKNSEKDPHGNTIFQIVAPQIIRDKVLESLHNTGISGQLGRDKTYEAVGEDFTGWDGKHWCQCDFLCAYKIRSWVWKIAPSFISPSIYTTFR